MPHTSLGERVFAPLENPHEQRDLTMTTQWVHDGLKHCSRCGKRLPVEQFARKPQLSSGYDSWCPPCRAENLREWRAKRRGAG